MFVCSPLTRCNVSLYICIYIVLSIPANSRSISVISPFLSLSITLDAVRCSQPYFKLYAQAHEIHLHAVAGGGTHRQKPLHSHDQRNEQKPAQQKRSWLIQRAENEWLKTANTPINIGGHNNNN